MTCDAAADDARHFEKRRRVEAEPFGKDQSFGEREAIEPENEIDRELGAAAVADLADVKALGEQRIEHWRGGSRDRGIAADQADAVAVAHLLAGARHRHFEEAQRPRRRARRARRSRSGSQVEVQMTILPAAAGSSARSTTSST